MPLSSALVHDCSEWLHGLFRFRFAASLCSMSAVSSDAGANLATGYAALKSGQWLAARDTFQQALDADGDLPEASFGLALALWWLGDMQAAIEHMEQAYVAFRRRPDPAPAAACALRIGFHYRAHLADTSAASGWLALASRLIEDHRIAPLRGELLLMKAYHAGDPVAGERLAREALEIGRTSGNRDLQLCALSVVGTSLVDCGRIEAGLPLLDEAMAGCLGGEAEHLDTVVFTCCNTLVCCVRCAEFERASQWVRAAGLGPFRGPSENRADGVVGDGLFVAASWARASTRSQSGGLARQSGARITARTEIGLARSRGPRRQDGLARSPRKGTRSSSRLPREHGVPQRPRANVPGGLIGRLQGGRHVALGEEEQGHLGEDVADRHGLDIGRLDEARRV